MNIQDEAMKIHSKYGTTEKANYEIQLLCEKYAKEYHEQQLKILNIPDVIKSVCATTPICKIKIDDESCNPTDCPYFVVQTVSNRALWRIEPYFDELGNTPVTTYKVVDQNGTLQYIGQRSQCEYFLQHGC